MIPEPRHFACLALLIELLTLILRAKSPLRYSTISCYVRNIILSVLEYIFAFIHTIAIFTLHVQRDIIISAVCTTPTTPINCQSAKHLIIIITSRWQGLLSCCLYVMINSEKLGTTGEWSQNLDILQIGPAISKCNVNKCNKCEYIF